MNQKMGLFKAARSLVKILRGKADIPESLADNQLLQVILNRRSVRTFTSQPVGDDIMAAILEAGRLAPSTVNLQTWSFAVFDDELWIATFGHRIPFRGSRAMIIISDTCRARQVVDVFPYSPLVEYTVGVMNASLAAMNMNIAAEALGVSSVMLSETGRSGLLDAKFLKEKLSLPDGAIPLMTMVFGYASGSRPAMPPRLPAGEIIFKGAYQPPDRAVMEDWLSQMRAGFKVSHISTSFENQLKVYQNKLGQAEKDLHDMIYRTEES